MLSNIPRQTDRESADGGRMRSTVGKEAGSRQAIDGEPIRTGHTPDAIARSLLDNLHYLQGKLPQHATRNDWYMALAYAVRDRMLEGYIATVEAIAGTDTPTKVVAYLSAEFLTGPHL